MELSSLFPHQPSIGHFLAFANSPEAEKMSDVTLVATGGAKRQVKKFRCHKILLATHSRFLKSLLLGHEGQEDCTITLDDVDASEVEAVLKFIYSGRISEGQQREGEGVKQLLKLDAVDDGTMVKAEEGLVKMEDEEEILTEEESEGIRPKRKRKRNPRYEESKEEFYEACCDVEFTSREDLQQHRTTTLCGKLTFKSRRQSTSVGTSSAKRKRPAVKKDNSLECCDKKFEEEILYATHKESVHEEGPSSDRFMICCDEKLFGTFKVHLKTSHKLDESTEQSTCCDERFDDLNDLTKHCTSTHGLRLSTFKRFLCCATKLNSIEDYKKHKEEDASHLECSQCTFISKDERHLNFHLYQKHSVDEKKDDATSALSCMYCQKTFKHVQQRVDHEDRHDGKMKYSCNTCGKSFKLMSSLKSHVYRMGKQHNPEANEYNCDSCETVFSTVTAKRKHNRMEHQRKVAHACTDCDQEFVDKHRLNNHTKAAHLKTRDVQCTSCGKLFATQERMRVHERFVHVVEDSKVKCDACPKEFSNRERMVDHRRSVHRDRKYQCDTCGSTFKNSSTLKSHVVSLHVDQDKKPLKCGICGKGFLHESRLKAHEIIHSDDAPFNCQFCGRPNKCKNNNLKHEKRCKKAVKPKTSQDATAAVQEQQVMAVVEQQQQQPQQIQVFQQQQDGQEQFIFLANTLPQEHSGQ